MYQLENVEIPGGGDGLGAAADLELAVDVVDVALHGALAMISRSAISWLE